MVIAFPASAYLAEKDGLAFSAEQFLLNSSSQEVLAVRILKCTMSPSSGLGFISDSMVQTQDEAAEMLQVFLQLLLPIPAGVE